MNLDYKSFLEGKLLKDRYLRVEGINEGSFGVVSLAKDTKKKNMLVALKYNTSSMEDFKAFEGADGKSNYANAPIEHPKLDKELILRETQEEVRMLKKVGRHPNITCLIDNFDTYIVMEYVLRGDLHDAIQLGIAPVSTRDVVDVFMQLVNAVEHCHKMGVYHRDIKPENILIAEDWSIKLTDFGLATDHLWCKDFDVGSERYMAPELLEHNDSDEYRADKVDLWSMGICLLNIVFGKSPFRAADSKDKLFLYFAANRETLFDIFPTMSYDLFGILRHSLTIDPENRSLEQMKDALKKIEVLTYDYEFEEEEEAEEEAKMKEATKPFEENSIRKEQFIPLELPTEHQKRNERELELGQFIPKSAPEHSLLTSHLKNFNSEKHDPASKQDHLTIERNIPDTILEVEATERAKKNLKKDIYVVPKGRFPHYRKPINIPTGIRHRDRSSDGRVIKKPLENTFDKQSPFAREDFFTPHSVFDHYMRKTNQHRKFDHRAREYERRYYNNTSGDTHRNRAWKQRRNKHIQYSDRYRNGNRVQGRRKKVASTRYSFRNKKYDLDGDLNPRNIPASHQYPTSSLSRSIKVPVMNFSSPNGKYIPPNMRCRPPTPPSILKSHKESQPIPQSEEFAIDDDDLFMFEEGGAGRNNNDAIETNHSVCDEEFDSPDIDKLSQKFSDECAIESSDTHGHLLGSPVLHKYVPPHQRKSFHTPVQHKFARRDSFGRKQNTQSLSSSVPIRKPCFSFGRRRPRTGVDDTYSQRSRPNSFISGKREADKMVSNDFGLSYINLEEDDEVKRRQLNSNTRVR